MEWVPGSLALAQEKMDWVRREGMARQER